jgi:AcrR family transcriptional regulator
MGRARSDGSAQDGQGEPGLESSDGRLLRSVRSRQRIVEALFELVEEGEFVPTGEQVAARAGVGLRTVFRHFEDMETLFAELQARVERVVQPILVAGVSEGPLEARATAFVKQRANAYERAAPFQRAGDLQRWRSAFIRASHARTVRELRANLRAALPAQDELPTAMQQALELVTSFEAWERLRSDQDLGKERAQEVVRGAVLTLLGQAS